MNGNCFVVKKRGYKNDILFVLGDVYRCFESAYFFNCKNIRIFVRKIQKRRAFEKTI